MEIYSQCPLTIEPHKWQNPVHHQHKLILLCHFLTFRLSFPENPNVMTSVFSSKCNMCCTYNTHIEKKKDELYADFAYLGFMFNLPENRKIIVLMFEDGGSTK